jgi:2-amino-4-hydroxy-6-hydroxymethyldihydropteridine diphosphokinase
VSDAPALRVVIGLGANLGDRLATMREAVVRIATVEGVRVLARSRLYETAPVGLVDQPAFLNGAVLVECALSARAMLDALLAVERELGRTRAADDVRWGPRTIDLDVLWIEGLSVEDPQLTVPHPRLVERAFALVPMLDVAPGAKHPKTGEPYVVADDVGVRVTSATW